MDPRRLSTGEWVAAAGAVLLLVALFLPWYGVGPSHATAWQTMSVDDVLLAALAVGVLVGLGLTARRARPAVPVAYTTLSTLAGGLAVILVVWRLADPAPPVPVSLRAGAWLGLVGALAVAVGSWIGMDDEGPEKRSPVAADAAADAARDRTELLSLPPDAGQTT